VNLNIKIEYKNDGLKKKSRYFFMYTPINIEGNCQKKFFLFDKKCKKSLFINGIKSVRHKLMYDSNSRYSKEGSILSVVENLDLECIAMKGNESNFIELIQKQKEEGILYVIDTYGGFLQAIIKRRLFALPDQIEDCLNDVFFGIWKNINSFDEKKGSFQNWAAGIARLEAIDYLRKAKRDLATVSLEDTELPKEDEALLAVVEKELSEETQEILSCLNEKDQELFLRIYGEEEESQVICKEFRMTRDNLYVKLFRMKRKLRANAKRKERNI